MRTKWVDSTTAQVQKYVADMLRQHYTRYNDYMSKEADMRRELQRYVTTLEVGSLKASLWSATPDTSAHMLLGCKGTGCGSKDGRC